MPRTNFPSYRELLLASAAGVVLASGDVHAGTTFTLNTVIPPQLTTIFPLLNGDSLIVNAPGALTISSAAVGFQPDVATAAPGVAGVTNSGLILSNQATGVAIGVTVGNSLGSVTNNAGGTISATGVSGTAVSVADALTTLVNSGAVLALGAGGSGVNVVSTGSVGTITNNAGGSIVAAGSAIAVSGAATTISNSGTVQSTGASGAAVGIGGSGFVGTVTNTATGTLSATGASGVGVSVGGGLASLSNSGVIQTTGGGAAVDVAATGVLSTLTNNATGTITAANAAAINVAGAITSLVNNGLIQGTGASGVGINLVAGGNIGSITNNASGTITGTSVGLLSSGATGTITNNGTISGGTGIIYNGAPNGALVNSGLITGSGQGVLVSGVASLSSLTNSVGGTIQATGAAGVGLQLDGGPATLANAGVVQATGAGGTGINVNTNLITSFSNTGSIVSSSGTGVFLFAGRNITGGITNAAGGLIQGGPAAGTGTAIDESGATSAQTITNAGTIIGGVKQGKAADTFNLSATGLLTGGVTGQAGAGGTVNLNGGALSAGDTFTNVDTVALNSGSLLLAATTGSTITGSKAFNIAAGTTATVSNTVGAALTTNSGILNVGTSSATLTGAYTQTATGSLQYTINGATIGKLTAGGAVNIAGSAGGIVLNFTAALTTLSTSPTSIVTGTSMTVTPSIAALTATTSGTTNPFYLFPILTATATDLQLSFAPPSPTLVLPFALGLLGPSLPGSSSYAISARLAYGARLASLPAGTFSTMASYIATLSPTQIAALEQQAAPRSIGTAQALLGNGLAANDGLTSSVDGRMIASRATDGLAAGDAAGRGIVTWAQPFASSAYQGVKDSFGGFSADTYGAAIGADTLVRPDLRLGIAFGIANSDIRYNGTSSGNKDNILNAQVGLYGTWFSNGFFVDGIVGGGFNWFSSTQNMTGLGQQKADHSGGQFTAKLGAGYDWKTGGVIITPSVSLQEMHLDLNSYAMAGGLGPSANISGQSVDLLQSRLGARVAYPMPQSNGWQVTPEVHVNYLHNFMTTGITTSGTFSSGLPFAVAAPSRDADLINAGVGLTIAQKGPFALSGVYDYTAGETSHNHTFFLRVKTEF